MTALSNAELSAINCTLFANASVRGSATAELVTGPQPKKLRPTPGLPDNPIRSFDSRDVKACNDNVLAAAIVNDIRRVTTGENPISTMKREGFIWAARSLDYWVKLFGFEKYGKVRTALRDVKASGLLVSSEFWFNGNFTMHYRMAGVCGNQHSLPKKEAPYVESNIPPVESNIPHVESNTPITQSYTEVGTEVKKSKPVPTKTGTPITPVEVTKEEGEDPKPTLNNLPEKYLKLAIKWRLLYEKQYKTPFVMPTEITLRNFKDAMYGKVLKQAGINPDEFIECLFSHTAHFTHATGLNQRPDMKQVYLNIGVMVDQFFKVQKKKESDAKYDKQIAANIAAFYSKPVEAKPAEPVASMAEVLAGMAVLDAISKPAKPLETVDVSEVPEGTTEGPLPLTEAQKEAALKNYLATTLANKGTPANYLFGN